MKKQGRDSAILSDPITFFYKLFFFEMLPRSKKYQKVKVQWLISRNTLPGASIPNVKQNHNKLSHHLEILRILRRHREAVTHLPHNMIPRWVPTLPFNNLSPKKNKRLEHLYRFPQVSLATILSKMRNESIHPWLRTPTVSSLEVMYWKACGNNY